MSAKRKATRARSGSRQPGAGRSGSFARVAQAFARDRRVTSGGRGFGSGALKVDGRIFAMLSSAGQFVVKLPAARVDELARTGVGRHFDAGRGKKMKEWLALDGRERSWIALAVEAHGFVAAL